MLSGVGEEEGLEKWDEKQLPQIRRETGRTPCNRSQEKRKDLEGRSG